MFDASMQNTHSTERESPCVPPGRELASEPMKPVLIVLHQERSTAGRIGRLLESRGHRLDIRRPRFGDPLPKTLRGHAGSIIFGGPMSANDPDDYIRREIDWIGVPLREGKPFLGVCLGAQMLARHLGERVFTEREGRAEIGYYPIEPTEAGRALCDAPFPERVYQWHREGFDPPCGATVLARGVDFPTQAILLGHNAVGLQFHPEVTYAMMCRWTTRAVDRMAAPGAQPGPAHLEGWYRYDPSIDRWIEAFLDRWLAPDAAAPRESAAFAPRGASQAVDCEARATG